MAKVTSSRSKQPFVVLQQRKSKIERILDLNLTIEEAHLGEKRWAHRSTKII